MKDNRNPASKNYLYIDVLTILSAFAVVMLHANGVFWGHPAGRLWVTANFIETFFYFAVPVFFMISGATLMDYRDKYSTKEYLIRRAIRVGIPFFVWKIVCALVYGNVYYDHFLSRNTAGILINELYNSSIIGVYWFFLPLFVIYLSIPFLSSVREKKKNFGYVIVWSLLVMAVQLSGLMSGAVITESIFAINGVGRLAVQAIEGRDIPLLEGTVLFATALVILGNLTADCLYAVLDPRIRKEE